MSSQWDALWQRIVYNLITAQPLSILRLRQNGRHFPEDILRCIFLNENVWIAIKFSKKFVPKGLINNIPALVQIMAWHRPGAKPLSEPMLVSLLTHICVTPPQWVKVGKDILHLALMGEIWRADLPVTLVTLIQDQFFRFYKQSFNIHFTDFFAAVECRWAAVGCKPT